MRSLTQRRPLTLLGVVLALLVIASFVLVALNGASGAGTGPTQPVVVASSDLPSRVAIASGSVAIKDIPASAVPPSAFTTIKQVTGLVPLIPIRQGQPITSNMVASSDSASAFLLIPSGFVALQIPTSEQQGVGGNIQDGDYISVIATVTSGIKVATKTVFTDLHVIKAGGASADRTTGKPVGASSLTVVVTACQAEFLTWFLAFASLKYELESYHDYLTQQTPDPNCSSVTKAKGVTLADVQAQFPALF